VSEGQRLARIDALTLLDELEQRPVDDSVADAYAEALGRGEVLPPIRYMIVDGDWLVVDGRHRIEAHRRSGSARVPAECIPGDTLADALLAAAAANSGHGARRSDGAVRRAIEMAHEARPEWPPSKLARHVGCSRTWVRAVLAPEPDEEPDDTELAVEDMPSHDETLPASPVLPGLGAGPEESPPASGAGEPPVDEGALSAVEGATLDAQPVIDALRAAERAVKACVKATGLMSRSASYIGPQLRKLRKGFELNLPVEHEACAGEGCAKCQGRGWIRARSM